MGVHDDTRFGATVKGNALRQDTAGDIIDVMAAAIGAGHVDGLVGVTEAKGRAKGYAPLNRATVRGAPPLKRWTKQSIGCCYNSPINQNLNFAIPIEIKYTL